MPGFKYIDLYTTDPYFNLACEQYVFDCLSTDCSYLMLWQNKDTVVVGKYQNTYAEINTEYAAQRHIKVARRLSGGGAVYHDLGNLNYTFITDAGSLEQLDLHAFCEPVINSLRLLGVTAERNSRNDLTVNGLKFSGSSQYLKRGRVMHHGTLLFDSDLTVINDVLRTDGSKITAKGSKSVKSRVTNLKEYIPDKSLTISRFRQLLLHELLRGQEAEAYRFTAEDRRQIRALRETVYSRWDWNYGTSPACSIERKRYFDGCGTVEVYLTLNDSLITDLKFFGDFFSAKDPAELAGIIIGHRPVREELQALLSPLDISRYFLGLDRELLLRLLTGE